MRVDFRTATALNFAELYEAAILDGDVGKDARISGTVEDAAAANDDVIVILFRGVSLSMASDTTASQRR